VPLTERSAPPLVHGTVTRAAGLATDLAAAGLGAAFAAVAALRAAKPLHPRGVLLRAVVRRTGPGPRGRTWGAPWLDEEGEDHGVVRVSRSAGLVHPLPDVLGLALRLPGPEGPSDLLLATVAGEGVPGRYVFAPRREVSSTYGTVLPYSTPSGAVLLAARGSARRVGSDLAALPAQLQEQPLLLTLLAAPPTGGWEPFGVLELGGAAAQEPDPPLAFEPVTHPLPGLRLEGPVARVRSVSYAAARWGRGADDGELGRTAG
jgi:hypothetical protein